MRRSRFVFRQFQCRPLLFAHSNILRMHSSTSSTSSASSPSTPSKPKIIQYSSSESATHRTAPHSFDSASDHTEDSEPVAAFEFPLGPSVYDKQVAALTGINPLKFDLAGAIDVVFKYQHRGVLVFPSYLQPELKKRVLKSVKAKVSLLRAQNEKVTQDKVDVFLVDSLHREGVALATNEEDAVHMLVTEAPRIGDEIEAEGKPAKVIRRYLVHDNGATRLVLESQALPPALPDTIFKQYFAVADSSEPPPVMSEAEKTQKIAELSELTLQQNMPTTSRQVAFGFEDVDRVLHENLLGKEMPKDQGPEEAAATRASMEEALFAQDADVEEIDSSEFRSVK